MRSKTCSSTGLGQANTYSTSPYRTGIHTTPAQQDPSNINQYLSVGSKFIALTRGMRYATYATIIGRRKIASSFGKSLTAGSGRSIDRAYWKQAHEATMGIVRTILLNG